MVGTCNGPTAEAPGHTLNGFCAEHGIVAGIRADQINDA